MVYVSTVSLIDIAETEHSILILLLRNSARGMDTRWRFYSFCTCCCGSFTLLRFSRMFPPFPLIFNTKTNHTPTTQFFTLQIVQNVTMMIGPIAHFYENSKYYSAIRPRPNKEVDNSLPHITIQMPVYKESLEAVLYFFPPLLQVSCHI